MLGKLAKSYGIELESTLDYIRMIRALRIDNTKLKERLAKFEEATVPIKEDPIKTNS